MSDNPHIGSSFDDFLEEDGTLEEINTIALKRVVAWQIAEFMAERSLTKTEMARQMQTSRSAIDRLLDPKNTSVTLNTMAYAAKVLGKRLHIKLIDTDQQQENPITIEK